ncbi:hypothetical protein HMPREF1870_01826 [Bacteroidales bacterium KA00344]|nr:hypothetical protein HMPREF1870_01826 [Bacteroidales bacterium KA00344]
MKSGLSVLLTLTYTALISLCIRISAPKGLCEVKAVFVFLLNDP